MTCRTLVSALHESSETNDAGRRLAESDASSRSRSRDASCCFAVELMCEMQRPGQVSVLEGTREEKWVAGGAREASLQL